MKTETVNIEESYTKIVETTFYKIVGVKSEVLNFKGVSKKKDLIVISNEFRALLEQKNYSLNSIKTAFAAIVNKVKHYYKDKTNKPNVAKKIQWVKEVFAITEQERLALKGSYKELVDIKSKMKDDYSESKTDVCDKVNNLKAIFETANKMLLSAKWQDVATALAFFTGRRMIEVIFLGEFSKGSNDNKLKFSGVAKKGYEYNLNGKPLKQETYEIPCLIENKAILKGFERLKALKSKDDILAQILKNRDKLLKDNNLPNGAISEMELAKSINNTFHATLNIAAKELLAPNVKKVSGAVNFHDLRKIYYLVCVEKFKKPNELTNRYAMKVLLHETETIGSTYDTFVIENFNL